MFGNQLSYCIDVIRQMLIQALECSVTEVGEWGRGARGGGGGEESEGREEGMGREKCAIAV